MASKKLTAEQQLLFDALTPLQQKFSLAIIKGKNQTDAYKAAKGKAKGDTIRAAASRMYANVNVQAFLLSVQGEVVDDAIMSREEALKRLTALGRTSLFDLAEFRNYVACEGEDGEPVMQATWSFKDSALVTPEAMAAIAELTAGPQGLKIKLHDPKSAIKQLADLQGWEAPKKTELTGPGGGPIQTVTMSKDEYKAARQEMMEDDDC
ncbi:TPA: terminase small subunit [Escherichia coli]|nr:terminase small subunit [Escherichia coli]HCO6672324.1 terminase small subunit [Escherichia coli]HCO6809941.1 terminase small subunit [Escherichia coli]HCO9451395.1 terminase small subunit [Escherichia coli]HCO9965410.1 terminase small subunit [Escherichia coli]